MIVDGFQSYLNIWTLHLPFPCTQTSPCSQRHQNSLQLILGLRWSWSRSSWSRWRARVLTRLRTFIDLQDPSTYDIFFKSLDWVHSFMHLLLLWGSGFWVVSVTKCFWKDRKSKKPTCHHPSPKSSQLSSFYSSGIPPPTMSSSHLSSSSVSSAWFSISNSSKWLEASCLSLHLAQVIPLLIMFLQVVADLTIKPHEALVAMSTAYLSCHRRRQR